MNKKHYILAAILFLIVLSGGAFFLGGFKGQDKTKVSEKKTNASEIKIVVSVDFASQKESSSKEVVVKSGESALSGLKQSHTVVTKHYSFGDLVQSIDGVEATSAKFWIYYVNGKSASVGAGDYVLKNGDKIEWKLEDVK